MEAEPVRRTLIALALAGALFAGCGGDEEEEETTSRPAFVYMYNK